MDRTEVLMLRGTLALCPDCGDERLLVPVDGDEFCCTTCDAAVLVLDVVAGSSATAPRAARRAG